MLGCQNLRVLSEGGYDRVVDCRLAAYLGVKSVGARSSVAILSCPLPAGPREQCPATPIRFVRAGIAPLE